MSEVIQEQSMAYRVKREGDQQVPQWRFTDETYINWRYFEEDDVRVKCGTREEAQAYIEQKKMRWNSEDGK